VVSPLHVARSSDELGERLDRVLAGVAAAARRAGRAPDEVTMVAVSKFHDEQVVRFALAHGHRTFGESRLQEAIRKWEPLKAEHPDAELHLIGQLQTNKVRAAVGLFDVIHTVDRPRLARELGAEMARTGRYPVCLIQVNTAAEPQKGGVAVDDVDGLLRECREEYRIPVRGLMCIPPAGVDPTPHFRLLRDLAQRHGLPLLSMGMSADYEAAVACGATHVRVGQHIFGARVA
jgi:pyridoxal phosphate enzyme (YggS family)